MLGIRVSNIANKVQEKHLRIHFSKPEHGGGQISHIYFPLHNNDAVILYHQVTVVDTVCSIRQVLLEQEMQVQRLPENMLFTRLDARLDEASSVLLQVSPGLLDELRYNADLHVELDAPSQTYTLTGGWYQLEWAWHYLDCFMQQQEIIQSEIQKQPSQRRVDTPMDVDNHDTKSDLGPSLSHGAPLSPTTVRPRTHSSSLQDEVVARKSPRDRRRELLKDPVPRSHKHERQKSGRNQRNHTTERSGFNQYNSQPDRERVDDVSRTPATTDDDSDATYLKAIGGPIERSVSYKQAVAEIPQREVVITSSDDELDLVGKPHEIPFESVHSTMNFDGAKVRHSDENDTFEQFSDLRLNNPRPEMVNSHMSDTDQRSVHKSSAKGRSESPEMLNSGGKTSTAEQPTSPSMNDRLDAQYTPSRLRGLAVIEQDIVPSTSSAPDYPPSEQIPERYSEDQLQYQFKIRGIGVIVYFGSLVKEKTEGIVNAANSTLVHAGGVAYAISQAAHPDMERECEDYIRNHGELAITAVMHTGAGGQLKTQHVIHAVGPMWSEIPVLQDRVVWQLTQTFLNCLLHAEKMWLKSLAMPAISSGVFGVPLDTCVRCFLDALLIFTSNPNETRRLDDLRLVNNDAEAAVTSIVLIQTLLEQGIDNLTEEAVQSHRKFDGRELNMSHGRTERSGSFTGERRQAWSADLYSEKTYIGKGKQPMRRSASAGRAITDRRGRDEETNATRSKYDNGLSQSMRISRRDVGNERGRDRTVKSMHSQYASGKLSSHLPMETVTNKSSSLRSSKRPSTADTISRTAPTMKKSLLSTTAPDRLKNTKSSSSLYGSRAPVRRMVSSPTAYTTDYDSTGSRHGLGTSGHTELGTSRYMEADYELGLHSLPANLDKHSFREKFLEMSQPQNTEICVICLHTMKRPKTLTKCKHTFCTACIDEHFARGKPTCPKCGMLYGALRGDQPNDGRMTYITKRDLYLPGHERDDGTIVITYTFPDGRQELEHPSPGAAYIGIRRKTYLPNSIEGREVLRLLKKAFDARLVFTVGESRTSGQTSVLTWNDIHHKTSVYGGSTGFGYPDSTYLKRVKTELAAKGIISA